MEMWKPVVGYEGIYEVSNFGRIKIIGRNIFHPERKSRTKKVGSFLVKEHVAFVPERIGKLSNEKLGYQSFGFRKNGKLKRIRIHRVVAQAFIPNPQNKPQVNHKNGVKTDNQAENLEWATAKENIRHAHANGLIGKRRILNGGKKIDLATANKIRDILKNKQKDLMYKKIAEDFGVSARLVTLIRDNLVWKI